LVLTKPNPARYPFLLDAAEEVKRLDLKIENLDSDDYKPIVKRAEERLEEALKDDRSGVEYREREAHIEIPSYPVAIILAAASANDYIKRRYALAEAKRAYKLLRKEDKRKVMEIANFFNWNIKIPRVKVGYREYDFTLHFTDYLRNAKSFNEKRWKLVNRFMLNGEVYLTKRETARLLQEEIQRHIKKRLNFDVRSMLPESILERVERLKQKYAGHMEKTRFGEFPKEAVHSAFPPCVKQLYEAARTGSHLSHVGRFTLTSFLVSIGMKTAEIVDLFRSSSDFNERMTRYQVEHIAGVRGSRTKYIPPTCETLKTHGLCPGTEDLCGRIRHPLTYYRRKTRMLKKEVPIS